MAGYIGNKSSVVSSGSERKFKFMITETTTTLSNMTYTPSLVHVFHNGIRLVDGTDYTATNGTSITLTNAAENGDEVVVINYASVLPTNAYTKAESDTNFVQVNNTLPQATWETGTDTSEALVSPAKVAAAVDSKVNKTFIDNLNVDADTLDGVDSGSFLRSDTSDTFSGGVLAIQNDAGIDITNTGQINGLQIFQTTASADAIMSFHISNDFALHFGLDGQTNDLSVGGWSMGANKYRVWHAGNDGSGSGLDADILDGQHGSYYYSPANPPPSSAPTTAQVGSAYAAGTHLAVGQHTSHFWQTGANNPGQSPPYGVGGYYAGSTFGLSGTWLVVGASRAYATYYGNEYGWWNFIIKRTA